MITTGQDIKNKFEEIKTQYATCRLSKVGRESDAWAEFSAKINREIRDIIKAGSADAEGYKYLFMYWQPLAQLLELHFRAPAAWQKESAKKQLIKTCKELQRLILSRTGPSIN
jgi:hypothetical protein